MSGALPEAARRLFSEPPPAVDLNLEAHGPFIIGRLLEDGDGEDLSWLSENVPEAALASWVRDRGRRQLSRRSAAFWSLILAQSPETPAGAEIAEMLWTL